MDFYFILAFCLHMCLCEVVRFPGTGIADSCELLRGCWESDPGPLEKQAVLLTTDPSMQPLYSAFFNCIYVVVCVFVCSRTHPNMLGGVRRPLTVV